MSISTTTVICERIKAATSKSPIAVLRTGQDDLYDAFFANTIAARRLTLRFKSGFVGEFYGEKGVEEFKKAVRISIG